MQETKNYNLFDKNLTQENVKCHIQHEGSWLRWIVIEQVNYMLAYFQSLFGRINHDESWENEGKIH